MKDLGRCPKGHRYIRGTDQHGCKLRVCLRCTNDKGQQLVDSSGCREKNGVRKGS